MPQRLTKTRHLFQAHFSQFGHRVHHHQATDAFLQLAHVSLLFFGDRAAVRHVHQLLGFFAQLLAFNFAQTFDFCFERGCLFRLSAFPAESISDRPAIWWRIRSSPSVITVRNGVVIDIARQLPTALIVRR